jgi:uncharacterized repeat protein (TIGR01451 family)
LIATTKTSTISWHGIWDPCVCVTGGTGIPIRGLRRAAAGIALAVLLVAPHSDAATTRATVTQERILRSNATAAVASTLPTSFQETVVFSGLTNPTAVRFAPDGRVFVAEKSGVIKVFDSLADTTPTVFADLNKNVYNFWDRGLLGMTLDPNFPASPYVYVLYTYDADIGGTAPKYGTAGVYSDPCPTPPGPTTGGCVVSGRLSRLTASGNVMTGSEQVLINDWCQQFPSHSVGSLVFGADGQLYVSGGEGASFTFDDYGQQGNPCGDPPSPGGTNLTSPTGEGGALRSQDLRTAGDPTTLDGAILRVEPATGAPSSGNPLTGPDTNARRIVAEGLRNPFRFTMRPGTNEIWAGDVGYGTWEEIDRIPNPTAAVTNFGWPCYEGAGTLAGFAGLNICANLPASAVTAPYYSYRHSAQVVPGETCPTGSSAISGVVFYPQSGGSYPSAYNGALFFADHSRNCIWVMFPGSNGLPDPNNRATFVAGAAGPVDLQIGPGNDLFYVDYDGGTIRRVQFGGAPPPSGTQYLSDLTWTSMTNGWGPVEKDTSNGESAAGDGRPITLNGTTYAKGLGAHAASDVRYSLSGCSRFKASVGVDDEVAPNGSVVFQVYADATKVFDSGLMNNSSATQTVDVSIAGATELRLVVTNGGDGIGWDHADWALARVECGTTPTNQPPTPTIDSPLSSVTWKVGDTISFSGHATDTEDGALPVSALHWTLAMEHCPSNCHEHIIQTWTGVAGSSFSAPDHEYPSYLQLRLTATDSLGGQATTAVDLQPITVDLTFNSSPSGLQLTAGSTTTATPFTKTVIQGSQNSISAPSPQTLNGTSFTFASWSDGGTQTHNVTANAAATYTATYQAAPAPASADLRITKSGSSSNGTATWMLSITNLGPNSAQNVVVTDVLTSRLNFSSAPGCAYNGATRTVTCFVSSLASGASASFTLTTTITGKGGGWITNTAQVSSSTSDPSTANNSATNRVRP